jgi:hypothetical protein
MPRKLSAPWPVRAPLVGNAELGLPSSAGLVGYTLGIDDDAQWAGMETALGGTRIDRSNRVRLEQLIALVRLDYENRPVPAANVIKGIKTLHRDRTPTSDSPALRLARIQLETNKRSPNHKNIVQYAKSRLPPPKRGRHPDDLPLRRLIPSLVEVFEDVTGRQLSKTGFSRTISPRKIGGVQYRAGAAYGAFIGFVRAVLHFIPEAPHLPDWRLETLVRNRAKRRL